MPAILALALAGAACDTQQAVLEPELTADASAPMRFNRAVRQNALRLAEAGEYDEQLCVTAQRLILNADDAAFTIHLQRGDGNAFHTIQMGIAPVPRIVRIAMSITESGPLGYPAYVACKMVDRDRVNDQLDMRLRGGDVSCRDVNALTYQTALATLPPPERQRYENSGKPLRFVDDYLTSGGGEWLPLTLDRFVRDVNGEYLEVQAPAVRVPWDRSERVFHQGTRHCKLITLEAMRRWMTGGALRGETQLFPNIRNACAGPAPSVGAGSCRFYFAPARATFCQDYNGPAWTVAKGRAECAKRHASEAALAASGQAYEGQGGVFSEQSCARRDDVREIAATCVFNCGAGEESLWQILSADAADQTMLRACDLYIERDAG